MSFGKWLKRRLTPPKHGGIGGVFKGVAKGLGGTLGRVAKGSGLASPTGVLSLPTIGAGAGVIRGGFAAIGKKTALSSLTRGAKALGKKQLLSFAEHHAEAAAATALGGQADQNVTAGFVEPVAPPSGVTAEGSGSKLGAIPLIVGGLGLVILLVALKRRR